MSYDLLSNDPGECPYCKSDENVEYTGGIDFDGNYAFYPCRCEKCHKEWDEMYSMKFEGNYSKE